jgi:hypothetical protein
LAVLVCAACHHTHASHARSTAHPTPGLELAIFPAPPGQSSGRGLVTERRELTLSAGDSTVTWSGVPSTVDGSTVTFRSFTDPTGTIVRSQAFVDDAASVTAMLDGQIGQKVTLVTEGGATEGTLVSFDTATVTVRVADGSLKIVARDELRTIKLAPREGGFHATPSLVWRLSAKRGGKQLIEVSYQATGLEWRADHHILLHADEVASKVDLSTLVTVVNHTDKAFEGVMVDLVSAEPTPPASGKPAPHIDVPPYRVPTPLALPPDHAVELVLGEPEIGATAKHVMVYDAIGGYVANQAGDTDQGFGMGAVRTTTVEALLVPTTQALPAGRVELYREQEGGVPLLVADGRVDATPAGGALRIDLGQSSHVTGTRRRISFHGRPRTRHFSETFEVTLHNDSPHAQDALIVEHMYRSPSWEITDESVKHAIRDDRAIEFPISVPPGKKGARVRYTVDYQY